MKKLHSISVYTVTKDYDKLDSKELLLTMEEIEKILGERSPIAKLVEMTGLEIDGSDVDDVLSDIYDYLVEEEYDY